MKRFFLLFLIVVYASSCFAQLSVQIDSLITNQYPNIRIKLRVMDGGLPARGVIVSDFTVMENGVLQNPVTGFCDDTVSTEPVSVLLIIDKSGSMGGWPFGSNAIVDAKRAASGFVDRLSTQDEAALISFNDQVFFDQNWTNDKALLKTRINALNTNGGTALWDAIIEGIITISPRTKKKVMIVLTDGRDANSTNSFNAALNAVRNSSVIVYTIGLGSNIDSPGLINIANASGGRYYNAPNGTDLDQIYADISSQISPTGICELRYASKADCLDGSLRTVEVIVRNAGRTASASASYALPVDSSTFSYVTLAIDDALAVESSGELEVPVRLVRLTPNRPQMNIEFHWQYDRSKLTLKSVEATTLTTQHTITVIPTLNGSTVRVQGNAAIPDTGIILRARFTAMETFFSTKVPLMMDLLSTTTSCTVSSPDHGLVTISGICERALVRSSGTQRKTQLYPSSPNPFNPSTTVYFSLAREGAVSLLLYDLRGRVISTLVHQRLPAGDYTRIIDGTALTNGAYWLVFRTGDFEQTQKLLLLK